MLFWLAFSMLLNTTVPHLNQSDKIGSDFASGERGCDIFAQRQIRAVCSLFSATKPAAGAKCCQQRNTLVTLAKDNCIFVISRCSVISRNK